MDIETGRHRRCASVRAAARAQSTARYGKHVGEARRIVGQLPFAAGAGSPEVREGCHFAAALELRSMLETIAPTIRYASDMQTLKGTAMGRGRDHSERRREARYARQSRTPVEDPRAYRCGRSRSGRTALTDAPAMGGIAHVACVHKQRERRD